MALAVELALMLIGLYMANAGDQEAAGYTWLAALVLALIVFIIDIYITNRVPAPAPHRRQRHKGR